MFSEQQGFYISHTLLITIKMAYTGDYTSTDLPNIVFDFIGTIFVVLVDNAVVLVSLIVLIIILELVTGVFSKVFKGILGGLHK